MVDRLDVVEVLDDVDQLLHPRSVLADKRDDVLRPHRHLGDLGLEAGADDVVSDDDGAVEVLCDPQAFEAVRAGLEKAGLKAELAEVTMRPETTVELAGEDGQRMQKLLDAIEDLDDVQTVYTNASIAA